MPLDDDHAEALTGDLEVALNENAVLRRELAALAADVQRLREQVAYLESIRAPRRWWWLW